MENTPISVSDAIALVNQSLEYAFPTLVVEGEVSSFKVNQGKFVFFDIKDDGGTLGCFMMVFQLHVPLEDGMRVRVVATPKITAWGKFSLTVRDVRPVGEGSLKRAFDILHTKLDKEGLFEAERKRPLPFLPQSIGVISSTDAAGYKDFIKILSDRMGGMDIVVAHTKVQGDGAALQIAKAIQWFNQQAEAVEVLVIVRGGGSADDLSTFNDEPLVRVIAASRIPTLVGVGHEVDVTLADLVADVRASTPTNAAQVLVPDRRELSQRVNHQVQTILQRLMGQCQEGRGRVANARTFALQTTLGHFETIQQHFRMTCQLIRELNPRTVLGRGYALVFDSSGGALGRHRPNLHDTLTIETENYTIETEVKDVKSKETE